MHAITLKSLKARFLFPADEATFSHLLLLVHGRTGNLRLLEWYSKRFQIPGLAFISLQAPFEDRREDQKDEGYSWYLDGKKGIEESRKLLIDVVTEIESQGISAEKIFWLGFSQGAAMGLDLALRGPFKMGGFLCISGFCVQAQDYPQAFGPYAKAQRLFISHGSRDEIVKLDFAEKTYQVLKQEKVSFEFQIFDKPHSFHLKEEVPMLEERLKAWMTP